jgi:hypothetical protein
MFLYLRLSPGCIGVEHLTHNPKMEGSNLAADTMRFANIYSRLLLSHGASGRI